MEPSFAINFDFVIRSTSKNYHILLVLEKNAGMVPSRQWLPAIFWLDFFYRHIAATLAWVDFVKYRLWNFLFLKLRNKLYSPAFYLNQVVGRLELTIFVLYYSSKD